LAIILLGYLDLKRRQTLGFSILVLAPQKPCTKIFPGLVLAMVEHVSPPL